MLCLAQGCAEQRLEPSSRCRMRTGFMRGAELTRGGAARWIRHVCWARANRLDALVATPFVSLGEELELRIDLIVALESTSPRMSLIEMHRMRFVETRSGSDVLCR